MSLKDSLPDTAFSDMDWKGLYNSDLKGPNKFNRLVENKIIVSKNNPSNLFVKIETNLKNEIISPKISLTNLFQKIKIYPSIYPLKTYTFPQFPPLPQKNNVIIEPSTPDFDYMYLTDQWARRSLLEGTLAAMRKMSQEGVNVAIFCDRGARPIATLVLALWDEASFGPLPRFFFVNSNPKTTYSFNAELVPVETINQVRNWLAAEDELPNALREGSARVAVIDENKSTGKTAGFLADVVKRAFPDTVENIYCDWINAFAIPWRNNSRMIGADNIPGQFRSQELQSRMSELLQADLRKLAQSHRREAVAV